MNEGKVTVHTKLKDGIFTCYGTLDGCDYSFSSSDVYSAQASMSEKINALHIDNVRWHEIYIIQTEQAPPKVDWDRIRKGINSFNLTQK